MAGAVECAQSPALETRYDRAFACARPTTLTYFAQAHEMQNIAFLGCAADALAPWIPKRVEDLAFCRESRLRFTPCSVGIPSLAISLQHLSKLTRVAHRALPNQ